MDKETTEVEKSEAIETTITNYIHEKLGFTENQIRELTLPKKMNIIFMKDMKKWEEFKLGLRDAGYII